MFRRRFWLSLALTIPLVVTSHMVMDWFGYSLDLPLMDWYGPVLGSIVFWWGGWPFLAGGVAEIRDRQPGMMLLITMAISVAYVASMATSLDWLDLEFWWELAALVTIMLLGHWQEMKAIGQARNALAALAALLPDEAELVDGDTITLGCGRELRVGDVVLVRPGGRVPADGTIVDGSAELDESMITGESKPVAALRATVSSPARSRPTARSGSGSTPSATTPRWPGSSASSPMPRPVRAEPRCSPIGSPPCCSTSPSPPAIVTFVVWWAIGDLDEAIDRTVTVLVIACPHALGLAIPLVIALSTAVSASAGILVKDRLALERMRSIDTVLFDKTGTLTKGAHAVTGVAGTDEVDPTRVLRIAAAVEADSEHPLARAIVTAAARQRRHRPGDQLPLAHRARRHRRRRRRHVRGRRPGAAPPAPARDSRVPCTTTSTHGSTRRRCALPGRRPRDRRCDRARGRDPPRSPAGRRRTARRWASTSR